MSGQNRSNIFVRRARMGVRGTLDNHFSYNLMNSFEDGANSANAGGAIRNAYIEYDGFRQRSSIPNLRFGQYKTGYSLEALEDVASTPFVERAIAVEQLAMTHERDMGFGFYTPDNPNRPYSYIINVMNGSGRNRPTPSGTKMVSGRIQINTLPKHPLLGGTWVLGFSTRQGSVLNLNRPKDSQQENEHYKIGRAHV